MSARVWPVSVTAVRAKNARVVPSEGYATRGFSSAREALAAVRPGEFDLLLTDLMMPEMDGIALSSAVRAINPAIAVILMTGLGTIDTAVRALRDGALDYTLKPFKLNVILPAIARALTLYAGPTPRIDIADLPSIAADERVIRQVWSNLIGNALKYSAKRAEPVIKVSGRIEDGEAIYQIEDNGAGFDMAYADKLFGVFQRLHKAQDFAGTGVGLAIVQRILARHGGRIWAQGERDVGAIFQFALPVTDSPTARAQPLTRPLEDIAKGPRIG